MKNMQDCDVPFDLVKHLTKYLCVYAYKDSLSGGLNNNFIGSHKVLIVFNI